MTKRVRQQARIRGRTQVHNPVTGNLILCAWDDCERPGYEQHKIIVREPNKTLHYIFCSDRHKRYQVAGHRTYGKLAP